MRPPAGSLGTAARPALRAVRILSLILLTTSSPGPLAGGDELPGGWVDRPIAIDGALDEWQGRLVASSDPRISVAVVNDGEFLYVALSSADERVARAIFHRGLVVDVRPKGGTELAVEYPIGKLNPHGEAIRAQGTGADEPFLLYELGAKDGQRFSTANTFQIGVAAMLDESHLSYELRLPLAWSQSHPYCLDTSPSAKLAVEIEIPHESSPELLAGGHGGGMGDGGHRHASSGTDGGGPDERDFRQQKPTSLHVKARVQLASAR